MGLSRVAQQYECRFEAMEGLIYPDVAKCLTDFSPIAGKPPHPYPSPAGERGRAPRQRRASRRDGCSPGESGFLRGNSLATRVSRGDETF